ncbi:MAG: chemotaxis protein CheW [Nitrospirales bacterium]|nr:chemotaxis protein CheW [Nitrospirales bacterium]
MTGSFIIFLVDEDLYGFQTRVVKEVIWVPELFWNHSLPPGIAGMFSYRGTVLPVLNLHQWFGGNPQKLQIHDQVILVEWQDRAVGLLVDKVQDVTSLVVEQVEGISPGATDLSLAGQGMVGVANMGKQTVKRCRPRLNSRLESFPRKRESIR